MTYAKTELYVNKAWTPGNYPSIKKGDIFRVYAGSNIAVDEKGNSVFIAKADAYSPNGFNYTVDCEPHTI